MSNLLKPILDPSEIEAEGDHIDDEVMTRLAAGTATPEERTACFRHLDRCAYCHEILADTLKDEPGATLELSNKKRYLSLALAASILFILLVGGGLVYKTLNTQPQLVAHVSLDRELKSLLTDYREKAWSSPERVEQLTRILSQKGIEVPKIEKVILVAGYYPTKGLFGPEEILKVRIEKGVAYLEVVEQKQ